MIVAFYKLPKKSLSFLFTLFMIKMSFVTNLFVFTGVYRVMYRSGNTSCRSNLLVMEHLFHARPVSNKFDLKGSLSNRLVNTSTHTEAVLLDENLINSEYSFYYILSTLIRLLKNSDCQVCKKYNSSCTLNRIFAPFLGPLILFFFSFAVTCDSPLYILPHSKTILMQAIHNDTQFLATQSVMDYSLLVGLDQTNKELVVGIIGWLNSYLFFNFICIEDIECSTIKRLMKRGFTR